jgi:tetratricopeptide (TPR) repeat protein
MDQDAPRIIGDFKLKRELGRGGMGVVYLARQISLGRDVALKVLPADAGFDESRVLRFQREAAILGRLSHPNIVKVFTVGEQPPYHYLAMEFVDGTDLDRVLAGRGEEIAGAPVDFAHDFRRAAVTTLRDVSLALGMSHASGIVHRDVKPSNILLERTGRCVLADFGLARDAAVAGLTRSQHAVGTPYYMSPERFGPGEPAPETDVYAVGAVLYQCLVGVRPFEADTPQELMQRILRDDPVPLRRIDATIPKDLETIVEKCLDKDPARRYPNGSALAADLDRFLRDDPIAASAASPLTRAIRRMRRRRTSALWIVLVVVVAALALGIAYHQRQEQLLVAAKQEAIRKLDRDDTAGALDALSAILTDHSDDIESRFERAELLLRLKKWGDSAADFDTLMEHESARGAAMLGRDFARAIATRSGLDAIVFDGDPADGREAFYRGLVHQARRDFESAALATKQATELPPKPLEAFYSLGAIYYRLGEYKRASEPFMYYKQRRIRADVDLYLGQIEFALTNYDAARSLFQQYVARRENDAAGWNNLASTYLALAAAYDANDWEAQGDENRELARQSIAKARAIEPGFFLLALNEAVLAVQSEDVAAGEAHFMRALEGGQKDTFWHCKIWWLFARQMQWSKQDAKAVAYMEEAARRFPEFLTNFDFVFAYADILVDAGRKADALAILDAALAGPLEGHSDLIAKRAKVSET